MKLLYLVFKAKKDVAIAFESVLPICAFNDGPAWLTDSQSNLADTVRRLNMYSKEHVGNDNNIQIHAVIVNDEEAEDILRSAELRRRSEADLDRGTLDPKKMCKLALITFNPERYKIESIEFNASLHPAYRMFFEKEYKKLSFVRAACFSIINLEHQTEPMCEMEIALIEILGKCPLEMFFYLEATQTTILSLKQMLCDFIKFGEFRQSTKASLMIVLQALKNPFEFYRFSSEGGIMEHAYQLLEKQFVCRAGWSLIDCMAPAKTDEWLIEGCQGFKSPIPELLEISTAEVSEDQVKEVVSCCYRGEKSFAASESFLDCIHKIVNIGRSPVHAEQAASFYEKLADAHLKLSYQCDTEKSFPGSRLVFPRGTEVFPPASAKDKDERSNANEGPSPK